MLLLKINKLFSIWIKIHNWNKFKLGLVEMSNFGISQAQLSDA